MPDDETLHAIWGTSSTDVCRPSARPRAYSISTARLGLASMSSASAIGGPISIPCGRLRRATSGLAVTEFFFLSAVCHERQAAEDGVVQERLAVVAACATADERTTDPETEQPSQAPDDASVPPSVDADVSTSDSSGRSRIAPLD